MHLLFVGAGHSNLVALAYLHRQFGGQWPCGLRMTVVSPSRWQYYSGMLPGWVAGHYQIDDCRIDVRRFLKEIAVDFIEYAASSIDADLRRVVLTSGDELFYDTLCLDVGSDAPTEQFSGFFGLLFKVKAMTSFEQDLDRLVALAKTNRISDEPLHVAVVGAGAAGVELALAVAHRMSSANERSGEGHRGVEISLIAGDSGLLPGYSNAHKILVDQYLDAAGIVVIEQRATGIESGLLVGQQRLHCDAVLLANGQKAWPFLKTSGLALDNQGFVLVNEHHLSQSHANVFACGDNCQRTDSAFGGEAVVRSGVHAVFAGKVLGKNLWSIVGQALKPELQVTCDAAPSVKLIPYIPKSRILYLISMGEKKAVLAWGKWVLHGKWVWYLKYWIDSRFFRQFSG